MSCYLNNGNDKTCSIYDEFTILLLSVIDITYTDNNGDGGCVDGGCDCDIYDSANISEGPNVTINNLTHYTDAYTCIFVPDFWWSS